RSKFQPPTYLQCLRAQKIASSGRLENRPRNATIRATAPLDTVAVSRKAFQELLMHLPGLNATMQKLMSGRMKHGEDLESMVRKAAALAHEDLSSTIPQDDG